MQSVKSGDSSEIVAEGCKEALEADLHIEIAEKWRRNEDVGGIRKQGDATIMFGYADGDGLWLSEEEIRALVARERDVRMGRSIDAGIMYRALPSRDPHALWQAEQAVRILRSIGIDADGLGDLGPNTRDPLDLYRSWLAPGPRQWLAYAPGYWRRSSSELDYLPDCGRGLLRWQDLLNDRYSLGYRVRPWLNTVDVSRWEMFLDDDRFFVNTNESCLLVGQVEVLPWSGMDHRGMTESWMDDLEESKTGQGQPLSQAIAVGDGMETMVCSILWLLSIWFVFRVTRQQSKHKPGS